MRSPACTFSPICQSPIVCVCAQAAGNRPIVMLDAATAEQWCSLMCNMFYFEVATNILGCFFLWKADVAALVAVFELKYNFVLMEDPFRALTLKMEVAHFAIIQFQSLQNLGINIHWYLVCGRVHELLPAFQICFFICACVLVYRTR